MNVRVEIEIHPAANIFPMLDEEAYQRLKADIDKFGQRESIVFCDGKLIDGRNRLRACQELGIEPSDCELESDIDPIAYVLSANLHRRQLKTSQKAMCAAKLAGLPNGAHGKATQICGAMSVEDAAALFGVSPRSVTTALEVLRGGCKEVIVLCENGELSVSKAAQFVEELGNKKEQAKIAKDGRKAIVEYLTPEDEVESDAEEEYPEEPEEEKDSIGTFERLLRRKYDLATAAEILENLAAKLRSEL